MSSLKGMTHPLTFSGSIQSAVTESTITESIYKPSSDCVSPGSLTECIFFVDLQHLEKWFFPAHLWHVLPYAGHLMLAWVVSQRVQWCKDPFDVLGCVCVFVGCFLTYVCLPGAGRCFCLFFDLITSTEAEALTDF